jgi:serine/threonine-protein kinase
VIDEMIVERLFHEALELPPEERASFLEAHAPDIATRDEVLALLTSDAEPAAPLRATPEELAAAAGLMPADAPVAHLTGRTLGPYRILEPIGQGGMGTVYRAVREDLGNHVALKVIRGVLGDPIRLARFRQEQRVLARLEHEHIARLLDAGVAPDETPYLIMEYVEGAPISTWCDERGLEIEARLRLFLDICDSVAFAHRHAIVHRDIKPSNVLVTADGKVKLLDFGVAKLLEDDDVDVALTATGARILSPTYAAPEQMLGEPVTTATDVYGLGALLYELLAGVPPHEPAGTGPAAWGVMLKDDIVPPSRAARRGKRASGKFPNGAPPHPTPTPANAARARRIAGDLDAICLRALERDPARRYAAIELLRDDVARYLNGLPVDARLPTLRYRAGKFVRRNTLGVATAAVIVLLLVAGLAAVSWQARRAERARADAEELVQFLVGLFEASDPEEVQGRTITARELLEEGTARARELDERPEVQIRLLDAMARAHLGLGLYDRADSLAALALERERELHGERYPDFATQLVTLGQTRRALGQVIEADSLTREALALRRRTLGDRHDLTTRAMIVLAGLLHERKGYDEAEALAREALDARVALHGPESNEVADALDALATILWYSGKDIPGAEDLYREAVRINERIRGPDDLRVAGALINLAGLLPAVGKGEEAEASARRALEIRRAVYGADHPMTIHVYNPLANAVHVQGRLVEAREYYHEILRRYADFYNGDHPYVAVATNNLSATFYNEGALDSAEHYLRRALEMRTRIFGQMDATVAMYHHNLGSLLRARGDLAAAEPVLAEAYRLRAAIHGEENPITLRTGAVYGGILAERGKLAEAETFLRDILARQQDPSGEVSADAARTMGFLAIVLARRGEYDVAEALYHPALEKARERMPPSHPRRRELANGLAALYESWNRPEEAERIRKEELK